MSTPNPNLLANLAKKRQATVLSEIDPTVKGKLVRPGLADQDVTHIHDGVVKTKHLKPGQKVRAFARGEARGRLRTVESVTKIDDGAYWHVEWAPEDAFPAGDFKAAYRWYDESLDGATITRTIKVRALVPYQEV